MYKKYNKNRFLTEITFFGRTEVAANSMVVNNYYINHIHSHHGIDIFITTKKNFFPPNTTSYRTTTHGNYFFGSYKVTAEFYGN